MKKFIFLFVLLLSTLGFSQEKAKDESLIALFELIQIDELVDQTISQMFTTIESSSVSDEQKEFFRKFKQKLTYDKFLNIYLDIYKENFTEKEIQELIVFYQSPIGKKIIKRLPSIYQEAYKRGTLLGEKLARETIEEMESSD